MNSLTLRNVVMRACYSSFCRSVEFMQLSYDYGLYVGESNVDSIKKKISTRFYNIACQLGEDVCN